MAFIRTSYARPINSDAARLLLSGETEATWTFSCWARHLSHGAFVTLGHTTHPSPRLTFNRVSDAFLTLVLTDTHGTHHLEGGPLSSGWNHLALTYAHGHLRLFLNGALSSELTLESPLGEGDSLVLGDIPADLAHPALWPRPLHLDELASLHAAGPRHDLRRPTASYLGNLQGPHHWWPGDSIAHGWVLDRGLRGSSPLALFGEARLTQDTA